MKRIVGDSHAARGVRALATAGSCIVCLGLGFAVGAQTPPPTPLTPWICQGPTLPNYSEKCSVHPPVELDRFWFSTGCYDVRTALPLDCSGAWSEYFSTASAHPLDMDYWTGGHTHSRYEGDASRNLGGFWLDFMPADLKPVRESGEWQTEGRYPGGFVALPEASGVVLLFMRFTAPPQWVCMADDAWIRDPADPSCRTCLATFRVDAHVEGLELLPDSGLYAKESNPFAHTADQQFYGTPLMNTKLTELAQHYRDWYHAEKGEWVQVSFNDLSLPYGGVYDYDGNWDCPHKLHRVGRSADVNTRDRPWILKSDMDTMALDFGLIEGHKTGRLIHYELQ